MHEYLLLLYSISICLYPFISRLPLPFFPRTRRRSPLSAGGSGIGLTTALSLLSSSKANPLNGRRGSRPSLFPSSPAPWLEDGVDKDGDEEDTRRFGMEVKMEDLEEKDRPEIESASSKVARKRWKRTAILLGIRISLELLRLTLPRPSSPNGGGSFALQSTPTIDDELDLELLLLSSRSDKPNPSSPSLRSFLTLLSLFPLLLPFLSIHSLSRAQWPLIGWSTLDAVCATVGLVQRDYLGDGAEAVLMAFEAIASAGVVWVVGGATTQGIIAGEDNVSPEYSSSIISRATFSWVWSLIALSENARTVEEGPDDISKWIWKFFPFERSHYIARFWIRASFTPNSAELDLYKLLLRVSRKSLFIILALSSVTTFLSFATIFYITEIVSTLQANATSDHENRRRIFAFAFYAFIINMLRALIVAFYQWEQQRLALRIKSCLINTIYAKSLRINTLATSDESSQGSRGQTYNLISEDCATIGSVISHNLDNVLGPSISICGTVFWTWYLLGWGALLSLLAVLTVLYIASNWAVVRAFRVGVRMNSAHDATIGRISELIRSIKSIKASASENKHLSDVLRYRNAFLGLWAAQKRYQALLNSFWMLCPDLIICLCFFLFFVVQGATFDLSAAIAVSTLIRQLSLPLGVLPEAIKNLSYMKANLTRIAKYLQQTETKPRDWDAIGVDKGFHLTNAWFRPTSNRSNNAENNLEFRLRDLTFSLQGEGITVITGPSGSGKTFLLLALLGELSLSQGSVIRPTGGVAYVDQQPWCASGTIRSQIVFYSPWDESRYRAVLEACNLVLDMAQMKDGDFTETGAGSSTLSGGQQARIAIARALYSSHRYIFLDEPLAAVDNETARYLLKYCFQSPLMEGRTVVVTTHNPSAFRPLATAVFKMDGGRMTGETCLAQPPARISQTPSPLGRQYSTPGIEKNTVPLTFPDHHGSVPVYIAWVYARAVGPLAWVVTISGIFVIRQLYTEEGSVYSAWSDGRNAWHLFQLFSLSFLRLVVTVNNIGFSYWGSLRASRNLFASAIRSLLYAPLQLHSEIGAGTFLARFTDFTIVDNHIVISLGLVFNNGSYLLGLFNAIFKAMPILCLACLPTFLYCFRLLRRYVRLSLKLNRLEAKNRARVLSQFTAALSGNVVIRAFEKEEALLENFQTMVDEYSAPTSFMVALDRWLLLRYELAGRLLIFAVTLLAFTNGVPPAPFGNALSQAVDLVSGLYWLAKTWCLFALNLTAVQRISDLTSLQREETRSPIQVPSTFLQPSPSSQSTLLPVTITFRKVTVRYPSSGRAALSDINITLSSASCHRIAIVGRTGSGKSSCVNALMRFVDWNSEGKIEIDGLDLRRVPLEILRKSITFLTQDSTGTLTEGTIKSALDDVGAHHDKEIQRALHLVGYPLRASLSDPVSSGGSNLSAGERQLLILARALLNKNRILILDESFSSLSASVEDTLQSMLATEFEHSLIISISHRVRSILGYDRVLVLDAGRLVEDDHPKTLLEDRTSHFRRLWEMGDMAQNTTEQL